MRPQWLLVLVLTCASFALAQSTDDSQKCFDTVDKDPDLAIQYCTAAIGEASQLSTNNLAAVYHNRALAYYRTGRYDKALADINQCLIIRPNYALSLSLRGSIYSAEGDYNHAIDEFKAAIAAKNDLAFPYIGLCNAYDAIRKYDDAIEAGSAAIRLDPKNINAYWSRSTAYRDKLDYANAAQDLQSAIAIDPSDYRLYNAQANLYQYTGEFDKAFADYEKSLQLNPNSGYTYSGRAWAEWKQGNGDKAMADCDKALLLAPDAYSCVRLRAMIQLSRKDYENAQANMQEAVAKVPKYYYGILWLHIVRAHAGVDDREEFARNTASLDLTRWPGPIMSYLLGKTTRTQLLAQVDTSDAGETLVRKCESTFYLGEDDLAHGRRVAAAQAFRHVMNICPVPYIEYVGAREELKMLSKPAARPVRKPATAPKRP